MKIFISLLILIVLSGCDEELSNEQIISESQKCLKAGMDYEVLQNIGYKVVRVQCKRPRTPEKLDNQ